MTTDDTSMENHSRDDGLLTQPGMQLLLAVVGGMLLGWPVIQIVGERGHWILYLYVFSVWAVMVIALVFIGRAITCSGRAHEPAPGPDAR